ncbi:MAG: glycosyltransferase family 39 protein, partial [Armatimonadetes bacterium]|nr:glycosyltransferase family 39 protein [Armatimonadota bacterium]
SQLSDLIHVTVRWLGTGYVQGPVAFLMILLGALWSRRLMRAGGWTLLSFAVSGVTVNLLKLLFPRPRPWVTDPLPSTWSAYLRDSHFQSFPSAETATTFAVAVSISSWYPGLRFPLLAVAALVGVARVLVGGHHPSDIIAGGIVGVLVGQIITSWAGRRAKGDRERGPAQAPTRSPRDPRFGLLLGGSAILFLGGLGWLPLFGRDEALYAEAAREMLAGGDWITPYVNGVFFFEKPPLYYWLAGISYSVFGVSPFAARLPAALMAILTIAVTARLAARVWGPRAGLLAGLALATSLQMIMIGRMGILDVPLTCLIALALLAYAQWRRHGGLLAAVAFGTLVGLAMLLKGMAGGLAPAVAVVHALAYRRGPRRISVGSVLLAAAAFAVVAAPWFAAIIARHGDTFIDIFIKQQHGQRVTHQMQSHGGPVFYYLALIAISFFPWVVFLPAGIRHREPHDEQKSFWRSLLVVWIAVVLIPFSLVSTKLPGYVTPLFPAMAVLVGVELDRRLTEARRTPWAAALAGALLFGAIFALLPLAGDRLGARVGASHDAWLLVLPTALWVGGYVVIALGGIEGYAGRSRRGIAFLAAGQTVVVGALLIGVLPVLSPYIGGGPADLSLRAQREMPGSRIVLYETRPETVAFALRRTVPVFSHNQKAELMASLKDTPTALIAPTKEAEFWTGLPYRRSWQHGLDVLLEVPALAEAGDTPAGTSQGSSRGAGAQH